jgi:hypothetical protein
MSSPQTDKPDSGIKFIANLASCVPELATLAEGGIVKTMLTAVPYAAWELLSLIRYTKEVQAHHNFLPR